MKRIISLLLMLATVLALLTACGEDPTAQNGGDTAPLMSSLDFSSVDASYFTETTEVTNYVKMTVTYTSITGSLVRGDIIIRLFEEVAPRTVQNFQSLVKRGFYDGLTFHRIMEGFMIQGGASTKEEVPSIMGEFTSNGFTNNLLHVRGVISMARSYIPDSASSQFFIMHKANTGLDQKYASFGYVVYGMDTVDGIATSRVTYNSTSGELSQPVYTTLINKVVFVQKNDTPVEQAPAPTMEELDFSELDIGAVTETADVTDLVKLTVSYTDKDGASQTGDVIVRLFEKVAPETVANFQNLVKNGSYNGTVFHRVVKNFMIQGGALSTSTPAIKGEFSANGFTNNLSHVRGVISMARNAINLDSATSQFFIMHADRAQLNGDYASFGYVVYGMDTVDGIANTTVQASVTMNGEISAPVNPVTIVSACFVKEV